MIEKLTLTEFANLYRADFEAFVNATEQHQKAGSEGFVGERYERRTFDDWLREMAAYAAYVELQEKLNR